ncbi:MAG: DUF4331 domain-containing protein [Deltaproteobacteria bacterium]|nr:DUF4331 domain-containing protein [Deltaproteobacteria bacterium]MCW5803592.1 DUF4331 domain-containing protein [Deltaproteobacteria bacterium]
MKKLLPATLAGLAAAFASVGSSTTILASSHREAPAISEDQFADNTDVYMFISPKDPTRLVMVANYVPLLIPSSGPNFYRFSDSVHYRFNIDNDGDAKPDLVYLFTFENEVKNGKTFLYNTGPIESLQSANLNVRQKYTLFRFDLNKGTRTKVLEGQTAPWNVGKRSFPNNSYESVALQAVKTSPSGTTAFAGPRDEPFFVDLHVFDLLGVGGAPTTDGVNVMSLVLEVPITDVVRGGERPAAGATGKKSVLGLYASADRAELTYRSRAFGEEHFGQGVQVSRLGWPLVNEVIIPLRDKDRFNRSNPVNDVTNFGQYILDPEVPKLLNAVLGAGCAPTPNGGRTDIVGLLSPNGTTPADLLRININAGQTFQNSGFPNGRKLTDDVTDTLLTVACNNGSPIGDGVNANDKPFTDSFPYLASPASGNP